MKSIKYCSVRLSEVLHKKAKIAATEAGMNLQEWIVDLIEKKLSSLPKTTQWLCHPCGNWDPKGVSNVCKGIKCEKCGSSEKFVFPCPL